MHNLTLHNRNCIHGAQLSFCQAYILIPDLHFGQHLPLFHRGCNLVGNIQVSIGQLTIRNSLGQNRGNGNGASKQDIAVPIDYGNLFENLSFIDHLHPFIAGQAQIQKLLGFRVSTGSTLRVAVCFILIGRAGNNTDYLQISLSGQGCHGTLAVRGSTGSAADYSGIIVDRLRIQQLVGCIHNPRGISLFIFHAVINFPKNFTKYLVLGCCSNDSCHIPGGRVLIFCLQTVGVDKVRIGTACLLGVLVHLVRKSCLTSGHMVCDNSRSIVGRAHHHTINKVFHRQDFRCLQIHGNGIF